MGNSRDHDWTEARVAALSELWLAGTTGLEIAGRLGVTRSSVMGKLRRLGLLRQGRPRMPIVRRAARVLKSSEQSSRPPQKPQINKRNKRQVTESVTPPPPPPPPAYGTLTLLDLRHNSCRWPEGDGPIYVFCGRPQAPDSSYCEAHRARSMSGLARGVPYLSKSVAQA